MKSWGPLAQAEWARSTQPETRVSSARSPSRSLSEEFSARFEREARAIAQLNHPHVCQLYDVGPHYLVMEYIDGAPVKGPLPVDEALAFSLQICDGLIAAHEKGVIHRDLKPSNILLTRAGVKLLDFGIAQVAQPLLSDAEVTQDWGVTQAGTILGTPGYMSPE